MIKYQNNIKMWTEFVEVEQEAIKQIENTASLPFIYKWISIMPDVHFGKGATVGSVIPTIGAIIPAAVGVDIGCGMIAVKTSLNSSDLPDDLKKIRNEIENLIPHGRTSWNARNDKGSWNTLPPLIEKKWESLKNGFRIVCDKNPELEKSNSIHHLGTLGGGNHFIEICIDESEKVWIMLHSGSRGVGNTIGRIFIKKAKKHMQRYFINLPDKDLSYIPDDSQDFKDYIQAVHWAQHFAALNRETMLELTIEALRNTIPINFSCNIEAINCHHNYISFEEHFGNKCMITRKGAIRAKKGEMGIIPGSMGERSFIVRGKGNKMSFHSCSHGAGRKMSRTAAKKEITLEFHEKSLMNIECVKDSTTLDETPAAYKNIDDVMRSQEDLIEIVHTLRQKICVKGQ